MEFLLADLDRKRRNFYLKSAKFDVVKTFENYNFDNIKFPNFLSVYDKINAELVPIYETI
ncbi:hypothetical protein FACS1894105_09990 [Clostridia bacterium]|nr:hypothetical protein FACS1894105_09990 [Clostridia bacterium]